MAAPTGVTAAYGRVIISVYGSNYFGIKGVTPLSLVGTVEATGQDVYRITVGSKVGFQNTECYFTTTTSENVFIVVPQEQILITYTDAP